MPQSTDNTEDSEVIPEGFLEGNAADYLPINPSPSANQRIDLVSQAGPYRLIRELGRGGFGCVYLAEHVDSRLARHRTVAVKLLQMSGSDLDLRRFQNELNALRSVSHPGIVSLRDSGSLGPHLAYLAMEHVEGSAIDKHCEKNTCGWRKIVELVIQACHAIEHAHTRGVLHCDLKPSNILVTKAGDVVITDFGLVRFFEESEGGFASVSTQFRGTPAYMAPEQLTPRAAGETTRVSVAVDVFGLGATLYKLLSGKPPRAARSTLSAIAMTAAGEPILRLTPSQLQQPCPLSLLYVIEHALSDRPEDRYSNVCQFREDLENVLELRPIKARRRTRLHRFLLWIQREPLIAIVSAIAATMSIACIFLLFAWWRSEASRNAQLGTNLREAMVTAEAFQNTVHSLRSGEELSAEARIDLLTATRNQFGRFVAMYPHDQEMRYKYAQASYILAEYLNEIGEKDRALQELDHAIAEFLWLDETGYNSAEIRFELFQAFHKRGFLELLLERNKEGNMSLEIANAYIEDLHRSFPQNMDYADCYAANLHAKAKLNFDNLQSDVLRSLLREALEVAEVLRAHPESLPRHWKHRMSARLELAKLAVRDGNSELALAEYLKAVAHAKEVYEASPDVWHFRLDLLTSSTELASKAIEFGQTELGLAAFEASETHLEWLSLHRPDLQILPFIIAQREKFRSLASQTPD